MTVLVARTNTLEGAAALSAAIAEAQCRVEDLLIFNLKGIQLGPVNERLDGVPVTFRTADADNRDAVDEVLEAAGKASASAIVMGVRRRSSVGKLLLGSAAQQILLEATVPVIAVESPRNWPVRFNGTTSAPGLKAVRACQSTSTQFIDRQGRMP
ncbi:universal stress protein [Kocuria rosea]|uniref:universal stress protein n=1 Tax=Kocuria rosea TaxID=1275 RepID=UPI000E069409|nr:universal stress protein [Kocuria rosea]STX05703.1 Universal stress protein family [Kocuria rosea]